jgi:hypothetical protein
MKESMFKAIDEFWHFPAFQLRLWTGAIDLAQNLNFVGAQSLCCQWRRKLNLKKILKNTALSEDMGMGQNLVPL